MECKNIKELLKAYEPDSNSLRDDFGYLAGESVKISQKSQIKPLKQRFGCKHKQFSINEQQEILKLYSKLGAKKTADLMHAQYERIAKFLKDSGHWIEPANKATVINDQLNHIQAQEGKPLYMEALRCKLLYPEAYAFCKDYLDCWGNNAIKDLAKKFEISEPTVGRLRTKAQMPLMYDPDHPGYMAIRKRIRKLYTTKGRSTIQIAEVIHTSSQYVQNMLHDMHITMKPQHCVDSRYFRTKSPLGKTKLLLEIKRLYESGMPLKHIAEQVGIWEGTVSSKLTAIGIRPPRKGRIERHISVGNCVWCGSEFTRYISNGIKRQIFCNNKCKNKCKDLRRCLTLRMHKGRLRLPYENRFRKLALEFVGNIEDLRLPENVKAKVIKWRGIKNATNIIWQKDSSRIAEAIHT